MQYDRQSILQAIVEGASRAGADPSVTTVLRAWDYYQPGTKAQPLMPFLLVGVTDDEELVHDGTLWSALCQITLIVHWAPAIRDTLSGIRASVRSVMHALPGVSVAGLTVDGTAEISCSEPEIIEPKGDVVAVQLLSFRLWFTAPATQDAVLDPIPYLVDRDPETGATYVTCQEQDPRRIDRYLPSGSTLRFSQGFGAWEERATLAYTSPVQPLSTRLPPQAETPAAP